MNRKVEGHWRSHESSEENLPWPVATDMQQPIKDYLLNSLRKVEEKAHSVGYRGISMCRICGCMNGSREYEHKGWVWPAGFAHYIEQHGVVPTQEFQKFIQEESGNTR